MKSDEPEDAWNLLKKDHPDVTWIFILPILGPLEECSSKGLV